MPNGTHIADRASPPGRILLIDDEQSVLDMLTRILRETGHEVETANSGRKGLDRFLASIQANVDRPEPSYDLVITDLQLGDMSGLDVLRGIRESKKPVSVIILTGYASTETAMEAVRLGADDYLTKPVTPTDLNLAVRTQLESIRLARQVDELNRKVAAERDKLKRSVAELTLLRGLADRMMSAVSYVAGFEVILSHLIAEVAADVAVIYDRERGTARLAASDVLASADLEQLAELIRLRGGEIFAELVDFSPKGFLGVKTDVAADSADSITAAQPAGYASTLAVPLSRGDQQVGLLLAGSRRNRRFAEEWSDFITGLALSASEFLSRVHRTVERRRHFTSSVVEHTLDGIIVISPHTGEVLANPVARALLEIPGAEALDADFLAGWLQLDFAEVLTQLQAEPAEAGQAAPATDVGSVTQTHSMLLERFVGDRKLFLQVNINLLPEEESEQDNLLVVIHDTTQAREVEEMKNRLISNITHEVRTPTAVIKEFMSLILDGVGGELSDTQRQYMQIMHTNIERLSRLIENLLTLARSDTGGFTIVLKPIELAQVIYDVAEFMDVKLKRKRIKLEVDLSPDLPLVFADTDALTQILTNLVDNAFKYSPENTVVRLSAEPGGNRVVIKVTDQGYGIPTKDHTRIFKRFQRLVDEHDPRFQEGVGLGLALVKDLVNRHGGDIWLESAEGEGTTFFFSLQIASEDEEHRPA